MESQVTAALIAAAATVVAALITTAGYLYVELRKRRAADAEEPADDDLRVTDASPSAEPPERTGGVDLRGRNRG